ncbi:hypothetical protein [Mycobacterium sp. WUMAC-067]
MTGSPAGIDGPMRVGQRGVRIDDADQSQRDVAADRLSIAHTAA